MLSGRSTIGKAAEKYGLSKSTLGYYSKRHHAYGLLPPVNIKRPQHVTQIISAALETELSEYLKECSLISHGLSVKDTRGIAYSFAVVNQISIPDNWKKHERGSEDCFSNFLKGKKSLSFRKPEATSQVRAADCNKPVVIQFFNNLSMQMTKHRFKPYKIWNCDETNDPTVNQPPKVIAVKGK